MAKPQNTKPGCFSFSSFLRVFLCAGNGTTPPVHPYHITESEESENAHFTKEKMVVNDNDDIACAPGVVARLMGLDSLPNPKWVVKCGTPDSVPRAGFGGLCGVHHGSFLVGLYGHVGGQEILYAEI